MTYDYAIVVKSQTRLEALIDRFNTKAQAKFYIERLGGNFESYQKEHDVFYASLERLQNNLQRFIKSKLLDRQHLANYIFSENHLIIVIGQDGLVANTAKYSKGIPIVAVNPDKERYDGILLPFDIHNFHLGVEQVLANHYTSRKLRFAEASLNDGQSLLAFNDLFIGASSHVSARYKISFGKEEEEHSSSGIIVSTQAGSTGWLSSIFNMAYGVAGLFEQDLKLKQPNLEPNQLLFAVREPFKSKRTQTGISIGAIDEDKKLIVESLMPNNGIIFSDGIEKDFLKFNSGSKATIGMAAQFASLVEHTKKDQ